MTYPTDNPTRSTPPHRRGRAGLTLIEMLVAVSVLAVMILAFSSILVQSQRFITTAQRSRRSFQLASSLARIIRTDLRRASQQGFLAIATDGEGRPMLMFTAAGISHTVTTHIGHGTGMFICYGQVDNNADGANGDILWRPGYVLVDPAGASEDDPEGDRWRLGLPELQAMSMNDLNDLINGISGLANAAGSELRVPPDDVDDIDQLWQVLAHDVDHLSITWTDGRTTDAGGNLVWFGVDSQREPQAVLRAADDVTLSAEYKNVVEYDAYNSGSNYRAVWTNEVQPLWPKAIKIRFLIRDEDMPEEFAERGLYYEVIANIGQ